MTAKASRRLRNALVFEPAELKEFFDDIGGRMGFDAEKRSPCLVPDRLVEQQELKKFFTAVAQRVATAEARQRRIDKRHATSFNVFDLIKPDENKLSDILAILLDPQGDHGQGDLFLRLLFKKLGLGSNAKPTEGAQVEREAPTYRIRKYRRRMDVLVEAGVLFAMENKVDSLDQPDQVKDYLEHLRQCSAGHHKESVLIYLSPNGRVPKSISLSEIERQQSTGKLRCWSYQVEIREWLENCRDKCKAQKIREFLTDFITYIESHLKREPEMIVEEEETNEN